MQPSISTLETNFQVKLSLILFFAWQPNEWSLNGVRVIQPAEVPLDTAQLCSAGIVVGSVSNARLNELSAFSKQFKEMLDEQENNSTILTLVWKSEGVRSAQVGPWEGNKIQQQGEFKVNYSGVNDTHPTESRENNMVNPCAIPGSKFRSSKLVHSKAN